MNDQGNLTAFLERSTSLYFIRLDTSGMYTYANALYCTIFRYDQQDLSSKNFKALFGGESLEDLERTFQEVSTGQHSTIDLVLGTNDQSEFWTRWEFSPEYDASGGLQGFQAIGNDISERKRAEREKQRVQEHLQIILNNSEEGFILVDDHLDILSYNSKADQLTNEVFGVPLKRNVPILMFSTDESYEVLEQIYREALGGKTIEVERQHTLKTGKTRIVRNTYKPVPIASGGRTGVIITTRDITARKKAEQELIDTKNYYQAIIQNSHDGLLIVRPEETAIHSSPAALRILGIDQLGLESEERNKRIHPDDLPVLRQVYAELIASPNVPRSLEVRFAGNPTREYKWLSATFQNLLAEPSIRAIVIHFNDITQRKQAEQAVQHSEEKYRFLFVNNPQPMWIFEEKTLNIVEVNEAAIRHYGYTKEEFLTMTIKDIRPKEDVEKLVQWISSNPYSTMNQWQKPIWRHRKKSGEFIYVEIKSHPIEYQGRPSLLVSVNDLTKMVEAEKELLKSNERFNYAMKATSDAIWELDLTTDLVYRSDSFEQMFGLDPKVNNRYEDLYKNIHVEDLELMLGSFTQALADKTAETWSGEYRFRKADGTYAFISDKAWILRNSSGTAIRVVGSMRDITEKKNFEAELLKSQERFEFAGKATSDALWDTDLITGQVHWGQGYKALFGYDVPPQGRIDFWISKIHPEDRDAVLADFQHAAAETNAGNWQMEYRFYRADGSIAYVIDKAVILRDASGKPYRMIGAMQDISELKEKERQLAQEKNLLRTLIDHIPDYIYVKDRNLRHIINNKANVRLIGAISEEETLGKTSAEYFGESDNRFLENDLKVLATGEPLFTEETLTVPGSNELYWLLTTKVPLKNEKNEVIGIVGVSKDITERKRFEESLRQSNERYRIVAKATNDAIWDLNMSTSEILWNEGLRAIFGYSSTLTTYEWWKSKVHPEDIDRIIDSRQQALQQNIAAWNDEYRFLDSEGVYRIVLDHAYILADQDGHPYRIIGAMMDNTERFQLQEELEKQKLDRQRQITEATIRAQEKERTELGRELHDNINQILTTSKIYIEMAREEPEIREEVLEKSYMYVSSAIEEIRSLSKSLVPPSLGDIGLKEAILEMIQRINETQKVKMSLRTSGLNDVYLNSDLKLMVYRIVQEQLNNVLKHSKADKAEITVTVVRKNLNIIIRDDGVGFDQAIRARGIGLNNIMSRAELHHGSVLIDSSPGNGCTLKVSIPIK